MTLIQARGLTQIFPQKTVFSDFDLDIQSGEWIVIIGNNGSGKTTLLKQLAGWTLPQKGQVQELRPLRKAYVGQHEFTLHNRFVATAYEVVLSAFTPQVSLFNRVSAQMRNDARLMLQDLGLQHEMHERVSNLSGGQRQRVFIAKALLTRPDILFLDEPTSALDPRFTLELLRLLKSYQTQGLTIVMVSHDLGLAQTVADRVFCMEESGICQLNAQSITEELAHRHSHLEHSHV